MVALLILTLMAPQDSLASQNNALVSEWVSRHGRGGPGPSVQPIDDAFLTDVAKGATFHSVHYREYPVAVMPPQPLTQRNVFTVSAGRVSHFPTRASMEKNLVASARQIAKADMKALALAVLKVTTEYSQDGFFQFVFDVRKASLSESGGKLTVTAVSPVVQKAGDTGALTATLTFSPGTTAGRFKLVAVSHKDTVKAGVRPICQCTLLLDANPLVRRMAERDLLVMGKSAWPYISEQLKVASPELRREIERVWKKIQRGDRH